MNKPMKLLVVAPWGHDLGFRLGGAHVAIAADREALNKTLARALAEKETGVVALPEQMREWIAEPLRKTLAAAAFPLTVFYRFPGEWAGAEEPADEAAEIIQRAIGYHLKIKL
ncbi:MAG: hypothetical protein HZA03_00615 [Nitrospinae bacterium]|nr:hypothetical protein [Nitrospinota bacterium]